METRLHIIWRCQYRNRRKYVSFFAEAELVMFIFWLRFWPLPCGCCLHLART
jgi:hypothetical protein